MDMLSRIGTGQPEFGRARIRLLTLVRLRWLAIFGQALAVLLVDKVLNYPVPLGICFVLIAASAWLNIVLEFRYSSSTLLADRSTASMLAYDALQLFGLLYVTGGLANPFSFLLLVHPLIAVSALPRQYSAALTGLVALAATTLAFTHFPLPWQSEQALILPDIYLFGIWAAFICALAFMGLYAWRISSETRQLADALTATELVLAREQHLSALDGLAAAAAHELGTPLATISLVTKEMVRDMDDTDTYYDDVALIRSQAERCRDILRKLTSLAAETEPHFERMPLSNLIEEVIDPHRHFGIQLTVSYPDDCAYLEACADEPIGRRNPGVLYGLGNLVENAVDFAKSRVDIKTRWTEERITLIISDDGPGFKPDMMARLGEPYVTTRAQKRGHDELNIDSGGLGLGVFIAKTLLERSGARMTLSNKPEPDHGAVVTISWPRAAMDGGIGNAQAD